MGNLSILSRSEIEGLGTPMLEELADCGIHEQFLCDLALKHVAMLPEPNTTAVADRLHLPRVLTEELLYHLYREKLIEMRLQNAVGSTRYAMLDHGWERVQRLNAQSGYLGPAPVSLEDYALMMRLQAVPSKPASLDTVRNAFKDLVLPDSLLQTHLDQFLAIQMVKQFFGKDARQVKPVGDGRGAWLGKHGHVLEGQVTQKLLVYPGISQLLQHRWTQALNL